MGAGVLQIAIAPGTPPVGIWLALLSFPGGAVPAFRPLLKERS